MGINCMCTYFYSARVYFHLGAYDFANTVNGMV